MQEIFHMSQKRIKGIHTISWSFIQADLYLKTYVIGNLIFKAIKNMGAKQLPLIFRTIDRWFHLLGQEQDHYYQSYGL